MTSSPTDLADLLRQLRQERGLSVRRLAEASGVNLANVSRLENGETTKPEPRTLIRLAEALQVDASELLTAAGYTADQADALPSLPVYFRAKFGELPDEAVANLERYVARLQKRYGPAGPKDGEDEAPTKPRPQRRGKPTTD
jgi:transcriptional regulator with XRE-family HTH domain